MSAIFKSGNTAVITGGASGIGLALAKRCAAAGMKVLVADRNAALLAAMSAVVGPAAVPFEMDVGSAADWERLKAAVAADLGGRVTLLALNAGVGGVRALSLASPEAPDAFRRVLDTNLMGVVNGLAALLPIVRETAAGPDRPAAVVVTGSKQGITNPPGNPAYNASKAAVKALAEHLAYDLRDTPVGVHLLVPGWTWTGLGGGAAGVLRDGGAAGSAKPAAAWWPEQVVEFLEAKMAAGQFWVLCPDNEVSESLDRRRMLWSAGDAVEGRKPLSRWRDEYKDEVAEWMKQ
ncbi:hypothetical protein JX266_011807 [Neoarthrinium moseri]|nr:hypothetical protein JX266_011807 [Neoarthrinium moseri]